MYSLILFSYPYPVKHTLLLHDNDVTALFIKDLIDFIRKKSWIIINPEEAYNDNLVNVTPDVLMNNQGGLWPLQHPRDMMVHIDIKMKMINPLRIYLLSTMCGRTNVENLI